MLRLLVVLFAAFGSSGTALATQCGTGTYPFPFTDVAGVSDAFCTGIMEAYVLGVTKGTTASTFSPNDNVPRMQMTTFLQRSIDQGLRRGNRRAALGQWWTPRTVTAMQAIPMGALPLRCAADGEAIWAVVSNSVVKVEASTGKVLGTWTGAMFASHILVAAGKVFVASGALPELYVIDPTQPPGAVTLAATLVNPSNGLAYDGERLWTVDQAFNKPGSVSFIVPQEVPPYAVTPGTPLNDPPTGILYDGTNIWVSAGLLYRLDASGNISQSITGAGGWSPLFDGTNIWVFNTSGDSVSLVQASSGALTAVLGASSDTTHLFQPRGAAFVVNACSS
jgi:hypothetical protein